MATQNSLPALLHMLTVSLDEASSKLRPQVPPKDGISLLDVKNELFVAYLQNLVFLILLKVRSRGNSGADIDDKLNQSIVRKLVELQVYLGKGVRPLESRLKYQIDKVLRAADDATRAEAITKAKTINPVQDNDDDDDDENDDNESGAESEEGVPLKMSEINDLQYRPNPASFIRPAYAVTGSDAQKISSSDGVYKPPRIQATSMPTTGPREKESRKPHKSATLDEFVNTELSIAPIAEPSIGSTIVSGGRRSKSDKEKREEQEKQEYEERNFVRLPKESKKDKAKKGPRKDAGYGGEEWRGLGEGIERIDRLTRRKAGEGGIRSALEKSRKRAVEDGPRDSGGVEVGEKFQKRLKAMDGKRRDRGRR